MLIEKMMIELQFELGVRLSRLCFYLLFYVNGQKEVLYNVKENICTQEIILSN